MVSVATLAIVWQYLYAINIRSLLRTRVIHFVTLGNISSESSHMHLLVLVAAGAHC